MILMRLILNKIDIDYLKKEVTSLQSIDLSTFWDGLEDPSKVYINIAPDDIVDVDVPSVGNEETKAVSTLKTNKEESRVEGNQEKHEKLAWVEDQIIDRVKIVSL